MGDGGMWPVRAGHVYLYISTDDIDGTLAKARSLGGEIVTPRTEIPGVGWWGMFTDPTGNKVGLFDTTA